MCVDLEDLYDGTSEDFQYRIGTMLVEGIPPAPIIEICYADWSDEKLKLVRESFRGGITFTVLARSAEQVEIRLATVNRVRLQVQQAEHTSVLRAPAWDARLASIDASVARAFELGRQQYGGYLLAIRSAHSEFVAEMDDLQRCITLTSVRQS